MRTPALPVLPSRRTVVRPGAVALLVTLIAGWVGAAPGSAADRGHSGTVTVSAASSLADAFADLGAAFTRRHPQVRVRFNFGSSTALASQVLAGAPVDVYAAADRTEMRRVAAAGAVGGRPRVLAGNSLTIVVRRDNPERVTGLGSLRRLGTVALCLRAAPCGRYADRVLDRAGVELVEERVTRAADATATLAAVTTGDADAAVVYVTDARTAAREITVVDIPPDQNVEAVYLIAPLTDAPEPAIAEAFVAFATSERGRRILVRRGFAAP